MSIDELGFPLHVGQKIQGIESRPTFVNFNMLNIEYMPLIFSRDDDECYHTRAKMGN